MSVIVTASRPQIAAAHALARAFGHWWADVARYPICGARPAVRFAPASVFDGMDEAAAQAQEDADRAAYTDWANRCNAVTSAQVAAKFSGMTWDQIRGACTAADTDPDSWGGVDPAPNHTTQSGTLGWIVQPNGVVLITARQRGGTGPVWWMAEVLPGGYYTISAYKDAPSEDDRWEEDHSLDCPQQGAYSWILLNNALEALGVQAAVLPPVPTPPAYLPKGRAGIARIA